MVDKMQVSTLPIQTLTIERLFQHLIVAYFGYLKNAVKHDNFITVKREITNMQKEELQQLKYFSAGCQVMLLFIN